MEVKGPSSSASLAIPKERQERADPAPKQAKPLEPLEQGVQNNQDAAQFLTRGSEEVARANTESSQSKIEDVERASQLTDEVAARIRTEPKEAFAAQGDQRAIVVRDLLA